jgi:hypothetical protein
VGFRGTKVWMALHVSFSKPRMVEYVVAIYRAVSMLTSTETFYRETCSIIRGKINLMVDNSTRSYRIPRGHPEVVLKRLTDGYFYVPPMADRCTFDTCSRTITTQQPF